MTALLALLLCAAGIYGVTAYITSRRTHEIGVRMALGATPGNVHALVFRQGSLTVAAGIAVGLGLALVLMRVLGGLLIGLEAGNPVHVGIAVGVASLTAMVACWIPARRATRIDPVLALRRE